MPDYSAGDQLSTIAWLPVPPSHQLHRWWPCRMNRPSSSKRKDSFFRKVARLGAEYLYRFEIWQADILPRRLPICRSWPFEALTKAPQTMEPPFLWIPLLSGSKPAVIFCDSLTFLTTFVAGSLMPMRTLWLSTTTSSRRSEGLKHHIIFSSWCSQKLP